VRRPRLGAVWATNRGQATALSLRWLASVGALLAFLALPACKTAQTAGPAEDVVEQYPDELQATDLVVGTGEAATAGSEVTVHYTGWLTSGQAFDSSVGKEPLTFRLGAHRVIKGWDQGLPGMKVGGKRRLTIPPRLGYGDRAMGAIPPGSTLLFEVELLKVTR
jgi:FKBP-type peptidyl-prolyl cis-trans isomerase FkpA